ncbi:MAG: DNA-binding domain-containing protein [Cyanobacteria bacterium]|nr:DNA-binding domain-containing protein [Cyanobacteriota bacterium]
MAPDLIEIERTLTTLWTQKKDRDDFLNGKSKINSKLAADIDRRGVALYAKLIQRGRMEVMDSIYPACAMVLGKHWIGAVEAYMETCPPDHFNLNRSAKNFSQFLSTSSPSLVKKYPFLPELADYEWIELEVLESDKEYSPGIGLTLDSPEKFQDYAPVVNPVLIIRRYEYPIAKIVDLLQEDKALPRKLKPEAVILAVYREPEEHDSKFLELTELSNQLIEQASQNPTSYAQLVSFAIETSGSNNPQVMIVEFLELIEQLQKLKLLLGSTKI